MLISGDKLYAVSFRESLGIRGRHCGFVDSFSQLNGSVAFLSAPLVFSIDATAQIAITAKALIFS